MPDTRTVDADSELWGVAGSWVEEAVPVATDNIVFNASSGDIALNENSAALGGLNMTDYLGTFTLNNTTVLDLNDVVVFGSTLATPGTATIQIAANAGVTLLDMPNIPAEILLYFDGNSSLLCNVVYCGSIQVINGVTLTPSDALYCWALTLDAGATIAGGNNPVRVAGNISIDATAVMSNTGAWIQVGSGTLANLTYTNAFASIGNNVGVTTTLTANCYCRKQTFAGTLTGGAFNLVFLGASAGWWASAATAAINSNIQLNTPAPVATPGANTSIVLGNKNFLFTTPGAGDRTLTIDGDLDLGPTAGILYFSPSAGITATLNMSGHKVRATQVALGGATTGGGVLTSFSQLLVGAGGLARGHADNATNALALGSAYVETKGNITGTTIAVTATAGACHIQGVGAPTITDFDPDTVVYAHDCVDGGGSNANLEFDTHAPPGSLALMGVGI